MKAAVPGIDAGAPFAEGRHHDGGRKAGVQPLALVTARTHTRLHRFDS
jgi:hypothetical protein